MIVTRVVTLASRTGAYGGPFDTALNQARILASNGHDVRLVAGHRHGDRPAPQCESVTVCLERVSGPWRLLGPVGLFSVRLGWRLLRSIRTSDAVHVSFAREVVPIFGTVCALLLRRRVILQPHGMLTVGRGRGRFLDPVMRRLMRRADRVVALTEREASQLRRWAGPGCPPIVTIGNPALSAWPVTLPRPRGPSGADVLFLARLAPRKNVRDFLLAAQLAAAASRRERYTVVGPDGGDLAQVLTAVEGTANVAYEGSVPGDHVSERIARATVFVLTSREEPWGNGVVTAIAHRVPVVVPESAALAGEVRKHGAGLVYPDGDVATLSDRIHVLLDDPARYDAAKIGCDAFVRGILAPETNQVALVDLYLDTRS
jgi:glycosyltransferase involved in cell wall biosynthesis